MDDKRSRFTEPTPYWVSHEEGTHLVESKRHPGEMHSIAYSDDGMRSGRDTVTLREMTVEECAHLSARHAQSSNGDSFKPQMRKLGNTVSNALKAEAYMFGGRVADYAAQRLVDELARLIGNGLRYAWGKGAGYIRDRLSAREAARLCDGQGPLMTETIKVDAIIEGTTDEETPVLALVRGASA